MFPDRARDPQFRIPATRSCRHMTMTWSVHRILLDDRCAEKQWVSVRHAKEDRVTGGMYNSPFNNDAQVTIRLGYSRQLCPSR
jgi:hypothetical protein